MFVVKVFVQGIEACNVMTLWKTAAPIHPQKAGISIEVIKTQRSDFVNQTKSDPFSANSSLHYRDLKTSQTLSLVKG